MEINWEAIEHEFNLTRASAVELISPNILDSYRATKLSDPSVADAFLRERLGWGQVPIDKGRLEAVIYATGILTSQVSVGLPAHLREYALDHVAIVEAGISAREFSTQFIMSWGTIKHAEGILNAVIIDDGLEACLFQGLRSSETFFILQKYWYARCQAKANFPDGSLRAELNITIAEYCARMLLLKPLTERFGTTWFEQLLESTPARVEDAVLKTTYTRMSPATIARMAANTLVGDEQLPPLV